MGLNLNYIDGQTPLDEEEKNDARADYLCALKQADKGNIAPLISFART